MRHKRRNFGRWQTRHLTLCGGSYESFWEPPSFSPAILRLWQRRQHPLRPISRAMFPASMDLLSCLGFPFMAPFPLSSVCRDASLIIGPEAADHKPAHAQLVAKALASWAELESAMAEVLATMLGAAARPSIAMFNALKSTAQNDAIKAVADATLSRDDKDLFESLWRAQAPYAKHRNRFAHWIWAITPDVPDALLLCDPEAMNEHYAHDHDSRYRLMLAAILRKYDKDVNMRKEDTEPRIDYSRILVYRMRDLQEIALETQILSGHWRLYRFMIGPLLNEPIVRDSIRYQLLQQPRIAQALSRLKQSRKAGPPTPTPDLSELPEKE